MTSLLLLLAVLAALSLYSLLLLAVTAPKAYRNGYRQGVVDTDAVRYHAADPQ